MRRRQRHGDRGIAVLGDVDVVNEAELVDIYRDLGVVDRFQSLDDGGLEIAPRSGSKNKPQFNATDPNAYAAKNWAPFDAIVRAAQDAGITVDLIYELLSSQPPP